MHACEWWIKETSLNIAAKVLEVIFIVHDSELSIPYLLTRLNHPQYDTVGKEKWSSVWLLQTQVRHDNEVLQEC